MILLKLKDIRLAKGLSQAELAAAIHMGVNHVRNLENNRVKGIQLSTLNILCAALKCQPGDLLTFVPDCSDSDRQGGQETENGDFA